MTEPIKLVCSDCNWQGEDHEALTAPNPFDPEFNIQGCPRCKEPNTLGVACDELDCWQPVSCGTPTPEGYRRTCSKHVPRLAHNRPTLAQEPK